jgi:hypothetical protein
MGSLIDGGAQTQEHRLVDERSELVALDRRDEQVDGVRAQVDGRPDR